jgi:hypothetical protein
MRQGSRIRVIRNSSPKPAIPAVKEFCREPEHCKSHDAVGNHPMPASSQNEEAKKHRSQIDQAAHAKGERISLGLWGLLGFARQP